MLVEADTHILYDYIGVALAALPVINQIVGIIDGICGVILARVVRVIKPIYPVQK